MKNYISEIFVYANNSFTVQFIRYAIVGGVASVIDISVFLFSAGILHVNHILSNTLAFIAGLTVNYLLSREWVFNDHNRNFLKDFILFALIGIIGLLLSNFILYILLDCRVLYTLLGFLSINMLRLAAKLVSVIFVLFWNFIARRKLVYKIA